MVWSGLGKLLAYVTLCDKNGIMIYPIASMLAFRRPNDEIERVDISLHRVRFVVGFRHQSVNFLLGVAPGCGSDRAEH